MRQLRVVSIQTSTSFRCFVALGAQSHLKIPPTNYSHCDKISQSSANHQEAMRS